MTLKPTDTMRTRELAFFKAASDETFERVMSGGFLQRFPPEQP